MKKSLFVHSLVNLSMILLSTSVFATNYYVSTTGNDYDSGTLSKPFATIPQAITVAIAGDSIFVHAGTYALTTRITISKSGTNTDNICLYSYPGDDRPILDFSGMTLDGSNQGMLLYDASYWHIKGLRIKGAGDNGMQINNGGNNIIEFCDFYENRDAGLQLKNKTVSNQIINCDAYYNADYVSGSTTSLGGNADGFAVKIDIGSGNSFYGCRSWLNSDDGWDGLLYSDCNVSTTIENCWAWHNGYLKDGTTTNSSMNGNGFKMGGGWTTDTINGVATKHFTFRHNQTLKNCLAFENKSKGFDQNHNAGSMTLYNCTAYNNTSYDYYLGDSVVSGCAVLLENCLTYGSKGISKLKNVGNITNSWSLRTATNADFISVDTTGVSGKRKTDGSLPDITFMHLATTSTFVNAGTNVGITFNGTAPDLGCFETGTTTDIYSVKSDQLYSLFPNPTTSIFQIKDLEGTATVVLSDMNGRMIFTKQITDEKQQIAVDFLPQGLYLVKITSETGSKVYKLIKK